MQSSGHLWILDNQTRVGEIVTSGHPLFSHHCNEVIMNAIASQITSVYIVCSIVGSGADQRKHQSSASLAIVRGIRRWPVNSPHKGQQTRKMSPFDDVIMTDYVINEFPCYMEWHRICGWYCVQLFEFSAYHIGNRYLGLSNTCLCKKWRYVTKASLKNEWMKQGSHTAKFEPPRNYRIFDRTMLRHKILLSCKRFDDID